MKIGNQARNTVGRFKSAAHQGYGASARLTAFIFLLSAVGGGTRDTHAQTLAYDGFETYAASTALNAMNGGNGWTGAWTAVSGINVVDTSVSGALNYTGGAISISGGARAVEIAGVTNNSAASRTFTLQVTSIATPSDPVYFSFLFRQVNGATADFVQFALNDDTDINQSASIGDQNTGGNTLGTRVTRNAGTSVSNLGQPYSAEVTYLLVGKVEASAAVAGTFDKMSLFLNPTTLTEPVAATSTATANNIGHTLANLNTFMVRTVGLTAGDVYRFDELRVGASFASVVPEPAIVSLLPAAWLLVGRRRRGAGTAV